MHAYTEHYTVEDFNRWEGDWELIDGMPYAMTPSPSFAHQRVAGKLFRQFDEQLDDCPACFAVMEMDWEIMGDTVVRPDVLVVCHEPEDRIVRTPEVVVEVVSPSTTKRDEVLKFEHYEREGVLFYLLAYPEKKIAKLYRNQNGRFVKVGDYATETADLPLDRCPLTLDFSKVWP